MSFKKARTACCLNCHTYTPKKKLWITLLRSQSKSFILTSVKTKSQDTASIPFAWLVSPLKLRHHQPILQAWSCRESSRQWCSSIAVTEHLHAYQLESLPIFAMRHLIYSRFTSASSPTVHFGTFPTSLCRLPLFSSSMAKTTSTASSKCTAAGPLIGLHRQKRSKCSRSTCLYVACITSVAFYSFSYRRRFLLSYISTTRLSGRTR